MRTAVGRMPRQINELGGSAGVQLVAGGRRQ
jgi:hypothetical protein